MDRKELILTVSKELFMGQQFNFTSVNPKKHATEVGEAFGALVTEVERAYDGIKDSPSKDAFA